jgi:hypothetical protein
MLGKVAQLCPQLVQLPRHLSNNPNLLGHLEVHRISLVSLGARGGDFVHFLHDFGHVNV